MKELRFLIFLLLTSNFLLLICGQAWADSVVLRPVEDRYAIEWTVYPSGDRWDAFNDTTPNEDVNYVYTQGTGIDEGWGHSNFTLGTIDSVRLTIRHRSPATAGTRQVVFGRKYNAGEGFWFWCTNDAGIDTVNLGTSYTDSFITWANDPYDNNPWTQSGLNNIGFAWAFGSLSIGYEADSFGTTDSNGTSNSSADYIEANKFTMISSNATLEYLRVKIADTTPSGNVKFAICSDSGGYPDDLLWSDNTGQAVTNGWNSIEVTGTVNLTASTDYWLMTKLSIANNVQYKSTGIGNAHKWLADPYANDWLEDYNPVGWGGNNSPRVMLGIVNLGNEDNRVTQSFITVFYQLTGEGAGKARERRIRLLQEEDE